MSQWNTRQHGIWLLPHTHANIAAPFYGMKNEPTKANNQNTQSFLFVCMEGCVQLPLLSEPPAYLKYLLGQESGKLGINYRKNIRVFNSMFAFTSMGGRVDKSISCTKGAYVFRISGHNYHHIGSLLPEIGKKHNLHNYIYMIRTMK